MPLGVAVQLLRTPTAQLAVNGGSQHPDKRKAGGHGPTLADEVEHLLAPEPGGAQEMTLLPTPAARDFRSGKSNLMERNARPLNEVIEMTVMTTSAGGSTSQPSAAGRPSSAVPSPGQLNLGEPDGVFPPGSPSG
jgi:hypothetical protein